MRDYGVVRVRFWDWAKRKKLSPEAREMALYLLTCPHANSLGCFRLPVAYICDDLGIKPTAAMTALGELAGAEFIDRDLDSGWTWIVDYLEHNPIPNGKVGKAIVKLVDQVPTALPFHSALIADLFKHDFIDHDALQELARKRQSRQTVSPTQDTVSGAPEPIDPIQTHEHDQEHDQTQDQGQGRAIALVQPLDEAVSVFNQTAERVGWPKVQHLNAERKRGLNARLRECGGIVGWQSAIAKAEASDFLSGRSTPTEGHEGWRFTFDFMLVAKRFTKLMEGGYDNRPGQTNGSSLSTALAGLA